MPKDSKKLSRFWQELKRRNVVRVITVYAGVAFVIIELINNITEPLHLPEWTPTLVIVLLATGFPVVVIFSWIYDVQPEGGIVKTEPVQMVRTEDKPKSSNSWRIASYISFALIVGLIIYNVLSRDRESEEKVILEKSIAVLPFQNMSQEEGNEHFVDGLVDDLLNKLSVIEELRVTSRTSSDMYRERGVKSVPEIAGELHVSYIMEGSVQRYGEKARITVQLIDAVHDDHVWVDSYDVEIRDVFQTQSEIAIRIASELDAILTSEKKSIIQQQKTGSIKAFELYQLGLFYWNKRTGDGYADAIPYFEQAIETDPSYGLAYAGLANTYYLMALQGYMDYGEGKDKAVELASRALELDENLSEAYTVLASLYDYMEWDWEKAEAAFQKAILLNPNYSTAHQYYGEHLALIGRPVEARMELDKAIELDPLSFVIRHISAWLYYNQGYFEEALGEVKICNEIQEGHPWAIEHEFFIYYQLGREDEAYKALRELLMATPRYDLGTADRIYQDSGLKAVINWKIEIEIAAAEEVIPNYYGIANYLAMIGRYEEALNWLEKALSAKQTTSINYNIHFRNLHDNPRYQAILKQMGLGGGE